jgi:hypothetical protein
VGESIETNRLNDETIATIQRGSGAMWLTTRVRAKFASMWEMKEEMECELREMIVIVMCY